MDFGTDAILASHREVLAFPTTLVKRRGAWTRTPILMLGGDAVVEVMMLMAIRWTESAYLLEIRCCATGISRTMVREDMMIPHGRDVTCDGKSRKRCAIHRLKSLDFSGVTLTRSIYYRENLANNDAKTIAHQQITKVVSFG
jgi:hypothetical protein